MAFLSKQDIMSSSNFLEKYNMSLTTDLLMEIFKIHQINETYDRAARSDGMGFVDNLLDALQVKLKISKSDLDQVPKEGAFISVSNHPFGLLDGMILLHIINKIRPDFRVMANLMLTRLEPIKDRFILVNPFEDRPGMGSSFAGIKETLYTLKSGSPVGVFPAGEVSTFEPRSTRVSDKVWENSILKVIKKANVPIVPIYFQGKNSIWFHLLGKVHPSLRTLKIPSEFLNKKNKTINIRIGSPIPVQEQTDFEDIATFGRFLRAKTYSLGSGINIKPFFKTNLKALKKPKTILDPIPKEVLQHEINNLSPESLVQSQKNYDLYLTSALQIPEVLKEIGRLREVTFREIGEGSNRKIDLDEFDLYYYHLFMWDRDKQAIVGAYRIGNGKEIYHTYGKKGFYTSSLFKMKDDFHPVLQQCVELGRSFVVKAYQQKPLPLFMLWRGILFYMIQNRELRYVLGPVSISNQYSSFSKTLLIAFIKKNYFNEDIAKTIKAKKQFQTKEKETDIAVLLDKYKDNIQKLDKQIAEIEPSHLRMPVLLKKYIKQNAKIIGFNIDPKFNNALDGLMLLDMEDLPPKTIDKLMMEKEEANNNQS